MAHITNRDQVERKVRSSMQDMKKRFSKGLEEFCHETDSFIKSLTPVWSGRAVRNYIWSSGDGTPQELEPIDNGPTGQTNAMSLGVEPRRDVNEEAARESLTSLDFTNPFQNFVLSNNAKDISGLEFGLLPEADRSRSPNGMFGVTQEHMRSFLNSKGIMR